MTLCLKAVSTALAVLTLSGVEGRASEKSRGAFKPVVARQRIIYIARDQSGGEKVLYEYVGEYLRSTDGSELATLGLPLKAPLEARLRVGRDGNTYKLDYTKHTATLVETQSTPLLPHRWDELKEDIVGRETIEGLRCTGITVRSHGDETGTAWRELKSDILVRLVSFFGSKEDYVRVVLERFDISTRQEPDGSLFAIPPKWTVITTATLPSPLAPSP